MQLKNILGPTAKTDGNPHWQAEFGLALRFPRLPIEEIKQCMQCIEEPEISLRDIGKEVEIVIKLRKSTQVLPRPMLKRLEHFGVTLPKVFEAILWNKLEKDKSTIWQELAGPAVEAFRQMWHTFFKMAYLGQFHPFAERELKKIETALASTGQSKHKGRPNLPKAEVSSLKRRYDELLPLCAQLHGAADSVVCSFKEKNRRPGPSETRFAIFQKTRKSIHGMPWADHIFGGAAFKEASCGRKHAKLHDPKSWTPHNLAISLVTFERPRAYETAAKKLRGQLRAQQEQAQHRI